MAEYVEAIGRRKTASARVRLYPGTGEIVVNELPMDQYFGRALDRMISDAAIDPDWHRGFI